MANDRIQEAYAASKNLYDDTLTQSKWWSKLYIRFFWGGVDDMEIARRVLAWIPDSFSGKLLDVPVGTGVFTAHKYAALPNAELTCLDYSSDMLAQAQQKFDALHLQNAHCMQGDVGNLPFENERFDIVLSMNGFHAFPDKETAFSETARVLKKDGVFCGAFYIQGECRRTDFIVRSFLAKKGWFTPPFQTFAQLKSRLSAEYSHVELQNERSIALFRCIK